MYISLATTLRKSQFLSGNLEESNDQSFPILIHGRSNVKSMLWVIDIFPEAIETILLDSRYDSEDANNALGDSEDEELPREWCCWVCFLLVNLSDRFSIV